MNDDKQLQMLLNDVDWVYMTRNNRFQYTEYSHYNWYNWLGTIHNNLMQQGLIHNNLQRLI